MAMRFNFDIHPFGYQNDAITFGRMRVHSAGDSHEYAVDYKTKDGWDTVLGSILKRQPNGKKRSGHRNFLHLLADIMDDIDLDALGTDYVNILAEVEVAHPIIKHRGVGDYPERDYPKEATLKPMNCAVLRGATQTAVKDLKTLTERVKMAQEDD